MAALMPSLTRVWEGFGWRGRERDGESRGLSVTPTHPSPSSPSDNNASRPSGSYPDTVGTEGAFPPRALKKRCGLSAPPPPPSPSPADVNGSSGSALVDVGREMAFPPSTLYRDTAYPSFAFDHYLLCHPTSAAPLAAPPLTVMGGLSAPLFLLKVGMRPPPLSFSSTSITTLRRSCTLLTMKIGQVRKVLRRAPCITAVTPFTPSLPPRSTRAIVDVGRVGGDLRRAPILVLLVFSFVDSIAPLNSAFLPLLYY